MGKAIAAVRNVDVFKVMFVIGFLTVLEQGFVEGKVSLQDALPTSWIPAIIAWCKILIWINGLVLMAHSAGAAKWPSPPAAALAKALAIVAVAAAALTFAGPVRAQTATPAAAAPAADPCTQQSCTTWYVGGNLINSGANFDVIGSGLSGLAANGIMFGGDIGAQFWNGQWFAALEADAEYALTLNAPSNTGLGLKNSYALGGQIKLGYSLAQLFGATTSGQAAPSLPQQLANAMISPYIALGVWDRPWGAGLASGAGVQGLVAQDWTFDAEYLHVNYYNAAVNPNVNEQSENLFLVGLSRHFGF